MPVPTTPKKTSSDDIQSTCKQNAAVSLPETLNLSSSAPDPCVVAGYQDCLRETIRFLIHEEHLSTEHPIVAGLSLHLTTTNAQQELEKISNELAQSLNEDLRRKRMLKFSTETRSRQNSSEAEAADDSGVDITLSEDEEERKLIPSGVKTYEITLEEDLSDDEEDFTMEIDSEEEIMDEQEEEMQELLVTAQDILANQALRRELIRLVFQGCDLVASRSSQQNLASAET